MPAQTLALLAPLVFACNQPGSDQGSDGPADEDPGHGAGLDDTGSQEEDEDEGPPVSCRGDEPLDDVALSEDMDALAERFDTNRDLLRVLVIPAPT